MQFLNLYSENCKTLWKETVNDTNKWKDLPRSLNARINIKVSILPRANNRFSSLSEYHGIFHRTIIKNSKICRELQKTANSYRLFKKNKARRIILPGLKSYHKATVIKTMSNLLKETHMNGRE